MWARTVLAKFDNTSLRNELAEWVRRHRFDLVWMKSDWPDLIALGCFALVIDRNLIGKQSYLEYLKYLKETQGSSVPENGQVGLHREECVCILVDNIRDLEFPQLNVVLQVDVNQENAVRWVMHNLELASLFVSSVGSG
jgi:hypothetical protein